MRFANAYRLTAWCAVNWKSNWNFSPKMFVVSIMTRRRNSLISCAQTISLLVESKKLGASEVISPRAMVSWFCSMVGNRNVEGKEELPAALLLFSVPLPRRRGFRLDRSSFTLVIVFLRCGWTSLMRKSGWWKSSSWSRTFRLELQKTKWDKTFSFSLSNVFHLAQIKRSY